MPLTSSWSDFGTSKTWAPSMENIFSVTSIAIILLDWSRGAFNYAFNRTGTESLRISSNLGNRPGCGKTGKNRKTSNTIGRTTETDRQRDSPIHRKADLALRRIGCENSHLVLDLTTRGLPVLRGTCYEHSHLDLARSPNHRKVDPTLRRIGCEYSHLDLTTQGPPALTGTCYVEYSRHRPRAISEPRRGQSEAILRIGECHRTHRLESQATTSCRP